jgi:hypothetical protein
MSTRMSKEGGCHLTAFIGDEALVIVDEQIILNNSFKPILILRNLACLLLAKSTALLVLHRFNPSIVVRLIIMGSTTTMYACLINHTGLIESYAAILPNYMWSTSSISSSGGVASFDWKFPRLEKSAFVRHCWYMQWKEVYVL